MAMFDTYRPNNFVQNDTQTHLMSQVKKFDLHQDALVSFLTEFSDHTSSSPYIYYDALTAINFRKSNILKINLDHLYKYFVEESKLVDVYTNFISNYPRYISMLYEAADKILNTHSFDETSPYIYNLPTVVKAYETKRSEEMSKGNVPAYLRVNFQIIIDSGNQIHCRSLRSVDADCIGSLFQFEADVVRISLVKPRVQIADFECQRCHQHTYLAVEGLHYRPLSNCPTCFQTSSIENTLKFNSKRSKFSKFQEVKLQEPSSQVPEGDVPRSLNCVALGVLTQQLQPGMKVRLTGTLLPGYKFGRADYRSGLIAEKYFEMCNFDIQKKIFLEETENFEQLKKKIEDLKQKPYLYNLLAHSIAPEIYGMEDVKKGLLLQLIGGQPIEKEDGGKIRGDIHILLMGDPGVAKSQLMKKVCNISPRAVYTTGKGSSSVGLTAAIVKDANTKETCLEGGALVLADQGICCIDEFDKMDEYDRSAIYEVMEQQTVSIAKAGHCSTMPARAAVLAAANPANGRFDPKKSFMQNMNLPAALVTRFDLQFLLLDSADREKDLDLANHVLSVYRSDSPVNLFNNDEVVDHQTLRAFIQIARQQPSPIFEEHLTDQVVDWYLNARAIEDSLPFNDRTTYTTPRSLLAILRLSKALAMLRFSPTISLGDFEEAVRLNDVSKLSLKEKQKLGRKKSQASPTSRIFDLIRRMKESFAHSKNWNGWLPLNEIKQQVLALGMKAHDLDTTIQLYVDLAILMINDSSTAISFPQDIQENSSFDI